MKFEMKTKALRFLSDIQTGPFGSQLHKEDYVDDGTPIVTVEHLGNRVFTEQNLPRVSNEDKQRLSKYILKEGDIVFSRVGSVDRCSFVDSRHTDWLFSGRCLRVRPFEEISPLFLYYFFCLESTKKFMRNIAVGATMPSINTKLMGEIEVSYPDKQVQEKIANLLGAIDDKIELNNAINDNLVAVGTASIQKNVGRGALINLTEPEMDRLTLPDDFEIQTVSEFCRETKSGSTPSRTNNEYWENGTISWVKSGEVHNNITLQTEEYITPLGLSESSTKLLPKDTVLMAMYGVTAGEVGYLAIEATTNQAICGMICNSKADAAYLYFSLIQSQAAISRLSNGGAQDNLSKNFIDNIKIVVPSSEFIEELNLAAIVEQMTLNTKEIALLEELQATALAQLSSH